MYLFVVEDWYNRGLGKNGKISLNGRSFVSHITDTKMNSQGGMFCVFELLECNFLGIRFLSFF